MIYIDTVYNIDFVSQDRLNGTKIAKEDVVKV